MQVGWYRLLFSILIYLPFIDYASFHFLSNVEFLTGRYDIARALEKWGGLHEVSRLLSLKVRHRNRKGNIAKEKTIDQTVSADVDSDINKTSSKPCISQDTQKWLTKLKEYDINWVE